MPPDKIIGWVVTLVITAIAFVIRVVNLGYPNKLVFDETYYAKDGYSLLKFGYERDWPGDANAQVVAGTPDVGLLNTASFIVHPPVGKWLIGFGEALFGMNSFGWRFAPLVFGTLLIFVTIRLVRRVVQVHADRRPGRAAAHLRRPGLRDVPDRPAGHLHGLLRRRRGELSGGRPRLVPQPAGRPSGAHRAP